MWNLPIVSSTEELNSGFYLKNNFNNCEFKPKELCMSHSYCTERKALMLLTILPYSHLIVWTFIKQVCEHLKDKTISLHTCS